MTTHPDWVARGKAVAEQLAAAPGARLLDDLLDVIKRYVVFPDDHAAVATALWIAATHALPAFECAPRLVITSPGKRCGKSRLLDVIIGTCHRPLASANATVAAIFRSIREDHPPVLVIDEADTLFGSKKVAEQNEDLRALLNAGHQRGRPALRCVGPNQTPTEFSTFAMAALAGIGAMPDTITDRAVNVTMRRRSQEEKVSQFRSRRDGPVLAAVRDRLAVWATHNLAALQQAQPDMPVEDRAADTWEPLVAVADAAGGHWPATARAACAALVANADAVDEDRALATKLLADIQTIFAERCVSFMPSQTLVDALRAVDESPWTEFGYNASKLAFHLRDFGIKPGRDTSGNMRGYRLETFQDAFSRYLRQNPSDLSETTDDQPQPSDTEKPSDTLTRQTPNSRQKETAVQSTFLTLLTGSDGNAPEHAPATESGARPPGALTATSPGQTDRVARALAKAQASLCPRCERAPARADTRLCDLCSNQQQIAERGNP